MRHILIAEDEPRISDFLQRGLRAEGYTCTVMADGADALNEAQTGGYDLVLLDIGLPTLDGFEVLRRLRMQDQSTPVIMLTARRSVADTILSLDSGANDYLPKPFKFDELMARVRVRLRDTPATPAALRRGSLSLDLKTRRARVGDVSVDLSAREFALAEEFLSHPDEVISREQLLSRVWGYDFDPGSNVVEVYVGYLRGKLGAEAIETVRGMGYRLR
ncbi:response regulator transcription factor [Lacisediminihabitans sp.]|jgi:DNA-binding response OmpR family regulator|uniref:response regulator transcription factor n=1 Tax=Lacisediminihabitans sp. TaxID=2787631 RepID=UPI002F95B03D